jgi:chemotaxis protein histidine kinase CheA
MPMIDDDELRELFQTECEEHLQTLDDGLLRLESSPSTKPRSKKCFAPRTVSKARRECWA